MKKQIKEIITKNGEKVYQITTLNSRWYAKSVPNEKTGLPDYQFKPSSTWIASYVPVSIGLLKWYAEHGYDQAELLKNEAGERGSKTHKATEDIDAGKKVKIDDKYINPTTGKEEELSFQEYHNIMTYINWEKEVKPKLIASEFNVYADFYAGTVDRLFLIGDDVWLVDLKTSQSIFLSAILQISSYKHALQFDKEIMAKIKKLGKTVDDVKIATLQIGFRRNKKGYFFKEHPDKFEVFKHSYGLWKDENEGKSPKQRDYPLYLANKIDKA